MVLAYTFFKPYISKIDNDFSLFIYILDLDFLILHQIIHLSQKTNIYIYIYLTLKKKTF